MASYSKRSLVDKLGIKPGYKVLIINPPNGYDKTLGRLPTSTAPFVYEWRGEKDSSNPLDFIQLFTKDRAELEEYLPKLKKSLSSKGMLWISWPKGSSKVPTDLNENIIREIALKNHLVDVKVAAVDETWSGLKLVIPVKERVKQ